MLLYWLNARENESRWCHEYELEWNTRAAILLIQRTQSALRGMALEMGR